MRVSHAAVSGIVLPARERVIDAVWGAIIAHFSMDLRRMTFSNPVVVASLRLFFSSVSGVVFFFFLDRLTSARLLGYETLFFFGFGIVYWLSLHISIARS